MGIPCHAVKLASIEDNDIALAVVVEMILGVVIVIVDVVLRHGVYIRLCRPNCLLCLTLERVKRKPVLRKRILERNLLTRLEVVVRRPCHSLRSIRRLIAIGVGSHAGNIAVNRDDLGGIHHGHATVLVVHRGLFARVERIRDELDHILVKLGDAHALPLHLGIGPRSRDLARVIGGRVQRAFANRGRKVDILRGRDGLVAHLRIVAGVLRLQLLQRRGHRCDAFRYNFLAAEQLSVKLTHFIDVFHLRIVNRHRANNGAK